MKMKENKMLINKDYLEKTIRTVLNDINSNNLEKFVFSISEVGFNLTRVIFKVDTIHEYENVIKKLNLPDNWNF